MLIQDTCQNSSEILKNSLENIRFSSMNYPRYNHEGPCSDASEIMITYSTRFCSVKIFDDIKSMIFGFPIMHLPHQQHPET